VFVHQISQTGKSSGCLKASNSSSDLYTLNSDTGDLYGVVGPVRWPRIGNGIPSSASSPFECPFGSSTNNLARKARPKHCRTEESKTFSSSNGSTSSSCGGGGDSSRPQFGSQDKSCASSKAITPRGMKANSALSKSSHLVGGHCSIALEYNKPMKIFDMSKFKSILGRESRRPFPNRRRLQNLCISVISFVVDDHKMLNLPSWIMIINIVAIDLLKTELGLFESSDLFGVPNFIDSLPPSSRDQDQRDRGRLALCEHNHSVAPTRVALTKTDRTQHQLTASKRAFANAAASGAYNGDHYVLEETTHGGQRDLAGNQQLASRHTRRVSSDKGAQKTKADSDSELRPLRNQRVASATKLIADSEIQQSSSSSGFNSHCSSQNDSSAASSSSNIAGSSSGVCEEQADDQAAKYSPTFPRKAQNQTPKSALLAQDETADHDEMGDAISPPRGKRPPKLPHRIAPSKLGVFEPIPIPAPPTSAGGGPSGKANLILVSPTGLSPPLPKRKGGKQALEKQQLDWAREEPQVPEFSTIKHIDERGQCKLLLDGSKSQTRGLTRKLPAGIPSHAQLAPPATQRHILRYLMSATRNKLAGMDTSQARIDTSTEPMRYQRPLPILPSQRMANYSRVQQDESLYYCGLQARVSNNRRPVLPPLPISKSAINAILSDYRHSNQQQHNQFLRQQSSIPNLQQSNQIYNLGCNSNFDPKHNQTAKSGKTSLMKFFRPSSTSKSTASKLSEINGTPRFMSADNLHQYGQKSSPSILSQVGSAITGAGLPSKLKRSKGKKPTVEQENNGSYLG